MKLRVFATTLAATTLLLAGCGLGEKQSSESTKQDTNQTDAKKSNTQNNQKTKQHNENNENTAQSTSNEFKDFNNLSSEDKIALALFEPKTSEVTVSANELLNHEYTQQGAVESNHIQIGTLVFNRAKDGQVKGQPNGVDIYETESGKGPYHVKVVIDGSKIAIVPEKGTNLSYQELFEYGKVYNLKSLYEKYKNEPKLTDVAHMIQIMEVHVEGPKATYSEDSNSSASSEEVTRDNVIDKVEAYEGHKLDTSTYTYKEPEQMGDGRWGFSILDKAGNLEGSYIVNSDGSVEKYDAKGRRI